VAAPALVVSSDPSFLYLRKVPGVPVFEPHDGGGGSSLVAELLSAHPEQRQPSPGLHWPDGFEAGIAHRLDTWTSGLLIAARSTQALEEARAAFSERRLVKRYFFVTDRQVDWDEHVVDHPLAHDRRKSSRMTWKRGRSTPHRGRWYEAQTGFRRIEDRMSGFHLWQATITTGVMHQIRVHAAAAGLPLLGDKLYGGSEDPRGDGRFYLHHETLAGWPSDSVPELPLPEDWP